MSVEQSPPAEVRLRQVPDRIPTEGLGTALAMALPMLGSVGAIVLVAGTSRATGGRGLVAAVLFGLATLGFVVVQVDRQRRLRGDRVGTGRQGYLRHLRDVRRWLRSAAAQQRAAALADHPPPATLPWLLDRGEVRIRTPTGPAYLHVRVGCGPGPAEHPPLPPPEASGPVDVTCAEAAQRLVAAHRLVPGLPVTVDLVGTRVLRAAGPRDDARGTARAMVCSAAAGHAASDLRIAVLCDAGLMAAWDWVKWLPHAAATQASDAAGPGRLVATTLADLLEAGALRDSDRHGHLLLVTDGVPPPDLCGVPRVTELRVAGSAAGADVTLPPGGPREPWRPAADRLDPGTAEACARRLAARPAVAVPGADDAPQLTALLGLPGADRLDATLLWPNRSGPDRLRVPIGLDEEGGPVVLDLKESAEDGIGPHGLVVGATGSGKSELLRTLVLGLAATHSPDDLALVLVDFKGGATFAGLAPLPHAAAVITNLEDDLTLVDRMQDALAGELVRRQELLRDAGGLPSLREYRRASDDGADLPPLPSLLVVVDEFSELLTARPELLELLVTIGRLGRSLGVHLLLASQRLEEGRLRGLESHLSFRIGLRTFSGAESRTVLGVPDAHTLPNLPGLGYLRPGPARLVRFRTAFVSGPVAEDRPAPTRPPGPLVIAPFTVAHTPPPPVTGPHSSPPPTTGVTGKARRGPRTVLSATVDALAAAAPPVRRLWLPPLGTPPTLSSLLPDLVEHPVLGLVSPSARAAGPLVVPVGLVDRPREQRHDVLRLDLSGAGGHVAVVGGPRSGTSTLLHTLVCSLALTHSPNEAQVLLVDLAGPGATALEDLPHVIGTAGRSDPERVRRLVAHAGTLVDRRERLFAARGVTDPAAHRAAVSEDARRAATGAWATDGPGDVVLVVDGWSGLRAGYEDLEPMLESVARRGLAVGVHLVLGARRWAEVRPALRDLVGTRLELRLGDPLDSEIDRRLAEAVPRGRPGRGLTAAGHHLLTALPVIDDAAAGSPSPAEGLAALVRRCAAAWPGAVPARVRMLPRRVTVAELRADAATRLAAGDVAARGLLLGLAERDLSPVRLDPDADPHLLVLGDAGSGRTATLRTLVHEVARNRRPDAARLLVLDPRRTLLGELPTDHTLDHLAAGAEAASAVRDLAGLLTARLPGPEVTATELRERSWWRGADVWVVVDDHDLLGSPGPLAPLAPLLTRAAEVGLHLAVASRAAGAGRALHDPVLRMLVDTAQPALLLSTNPAGGTLLGQRPRQLPPGRGTLLGRGQDARLLQVAWSEPGRGGPG